MTYKILGIILDIVIMQWNGPCADWMRLHDMLPYEPRSLVNIDRWTDPETCTIYYRAYIPGIDN